LIIKTEPEDVSNLLIGKLDMMRAFILGKLQVSGDHTLGMKLTGSFN